MADAGKTRILWHGTTRRREELILRDGPDPSFLEPGGLKEEFGFSTALPHGPYQFGDPRKYAAGKARVFPNEGGPAIVEMEIPEWIVALAVDELSEVRFLAGYGLEELRAAWNTLTKRVFSP